MKSLFVFNPENDLALANGTPYFTPPKMAQKIRFDLQMLPLWLADRGDSIYAPKSIDNQTFIESVKSFLPSKSEINLKYDDLGDLEITPWGWSEALRYELSSKIDKVTDFDLQKLRDLSSRKTVTKVYDYFETHSSMKLPTSPKLCNTLEDVEQFVADNQNCMIKAPWSGSGKGVFNVTAENFHVYLPWIKGTLKKQGSVLCEVFLNKVQDFAMEFYSDGHSVRFVGYSVFENNSRFSYEQAIVANEKELRFYLEQYIQGKQLDYVREVLICCLNRIIPQEYKGYLGVDMMLYIDENNQINIMPCIELNLRMTMGLLSCKLGNDLINDGKKGIMKILFHADVEAREAYIKTLSQPQFVNGKLENGSLLLVPIYRDSVYTAVLTVS